MVFRQLKFSICVRCDMAFTEPMHRNDYIVTYFVISFDFIGVSLNCDKAQTETCVVLFLGLAILDELPGMRVVWNAIS